MNHFKRRIFCIYHLTHAILETFQYITLESRILPNQYEWVSSDSLYVNIFLSCLWNIRYFSYICITLWWGGRCVILCIWCFLLISWLQILKIPNTLKSGFKVIWVPFLSRPIWLKILFKNLKRKAFKLTIFLTCTLKFLGKISILKTLKPMCILNDIFWPWVKKVFAVFSGFYNMACKMCHIYQAVTFFCSFPVDLPMEYWK